ncbi:hypothetical protein EI94DRAFT_1889323 [Lactarius quietus]|nr:hypothetical protein EI94DRAFT_1889323 [Lactarius quietus]
MTTPSLQASSFNVSTLTGQVGIVEKLMEELLKFYRHIIVCRLSLNFHLLIRGSALSQELSTVGMEVSESTAALGRQPLKFHEVKRGRRGLAVDSSTGVTAGRKKGNTTSPWLFLTCAFSGQLAALNYWLHRDDLARLRDISSASDVGRTDKISGIALWDTFHHARLFPPHFRPCHANPHGHILTHYPGQTVRTVTASINRAGGHNNTTVATCAVVSASVAKYAKEM